MKVVELALARKDYWRNIAIALIDLWEGAQTPTYSTDIKQKASLTWSNER